MENLAKCYQREILKRECWDSMKVKGKAVKVLAWIQNAGKCLLYETVFTFTILVKHFTVWLPSVSMSALLPQAFHSNYEVKNYPMKERTEEELNELHRVETMRQIEQADSQVNE